MISLLCYSCAGMCWAVASEPTIPGMMYRQAAVSSRRATGSLCHPQAVSVAKANARGSEVDGGEGWERASEGGGNGHAGWARCRRGRELHRSVTCFGWTLDALVRSPPNNNKQHVQHVIARRMCDELLLMLVQTLWKGVCNRCRGKLSQDIPDRSAGV